MDVHMDVRSMIGHTPVLKLNNIGIENGVGVYAKLELMNPAGSVKDRVGVYMIDDAIERGLLKKGGTIVDATAGNTGIGIALAALNKGFKVIFTVPLKFSEEKQKIMRALGAEIVHTPREDGMLGAERKAEEILAKTEGAISLRQFRNPANPRAHYETTGPEIYEQMDGQIDYLVAGA
ncbi:MAG: cysteine synthase family protein, partial [Eubacterium sp.]|nr:cysteine synthase family protein [Eubacterium sp.]